MNGRADVSINRPAGHLGQAIIVDGAPSVGPSVTAP